MQTESLCPVCLARIPARKRQTGADIFLEKTCPEHGSFTTRIAKDARRFLDKTFSVVGKPFAPRNTFAGRCGEDCGWCDKHLQHICTGLIEITNACNLRCPVCYFGRKAEEFISVAEFGARLQTLLDVERGSLDVLQVSGGECTLHPRLVEMLDLALGKNVNRVLLNTNGLRLLEDEALFAEIARRRDKVEIYLQFDGFSDAVYRKLRGRPLLREKMRLLKKLNAAEIKICLAVTVFQDNLRELPAILRLAARLRHISGITFQRLVKVGSGTSSPLVSVLQEDILLALASGGLLDYKDLIPLPCSHENCTSLGFLFCQGSRTWSLGEYIDFSKCKDIIANRIAFDQTVLQYMQKNVCKCFVSKLFGGSALLDQLQFFAQGGASSYKDMKIMRILVKNFMDAGNFDFERARKCCTRVATGKGKVVPFCIHNALKEKIAW